MDAHDVAHVPDIAVAAVVDIRAGSSVGVPQLAVQEAAAAAVMDVRAAAAVVDVRARAGGRGRRLWTAAVVDGGEGVAREKEREREGGTHCLLVALAGSRRFKGVWVRTGWEAALIVGSPSVLSALGAVPSMRQAPGATNCCDRWCVDCL